MFSFLSDKFRNASFESEVELHAELNHPRIARPVVFAEEIAQRTIRIVDARFAHALAANRIIQQHARETVQVDLQGTTADGLAEGALLKGSTSEDCPPLLAQAAYHTSIPAADTPQIVWVRLLLNDAPKVILSIANDGLLFLFRFRN